MKHLSVILVLFATAGCAVSTGVMKLGPDTYQTGAAAAPARGGSTEARRIALNEANKYCDEQGKQIYVSSVETSTVNAFGAGNANVTFSCIDKGDDITPRAGGAIAGVTPEPAFPLKKVSTGSGFFVSAQGHVVTNRHVTAQCRELRITNIGTSERVAKDRQIDLALLKVPGAKHEAATFRSGRGIRTGDDILVGGYPLQGLLSSELNVSTGAVSALAGPGDDRRIMQITAPVQPGNSGGPVHDKSGNIVGIVVSRLDAIKIAHVTGSLPQNVNFAISEGAVRAFLDSHDVPYQTAPSNKAIPTADIAAKAKGYTVLIECWK